MNLRILLLVSAMLFQFSQPEISMAQTDTTQQILKDSTSTAAGNEAQYEDDEFNIFLLVFAIGVIGAIMGAAIIGAFAAVLFLLLLFVFVAMGIVSASVIIGLYKKSFESGFKSFIMILSAITGVILGAGAFWSINKIFRLEISDGTTFITGSCGGLVAGFIISYASLKLIRVLIFIFKGKMETN
ncbi:hypothetical protein BH10BAC2_BH10BAC2_30570 [soil metagenome]